MLEYNVRASILVAQTRRLARALQIDVEPFMDYRRVTLGFADGHCVCIEAPEYRFNVAVSSAVLRIIDRLHSRTMEPAEALAAVRTIERTTPAHSRWVLAVLMGLGAMALACILHADLGAALVAGVSSALGLLARKELGRRHWPLFSLPFTAALIGGILGGFAIRFGWTRTPGLCLTVPALMLVPGPHLLNGVWDILENYLQIGLCRLLLAFGILMASAIGVLLGAVLELDLWTLSESATNRLELTLLVDVICAGVAACAFGAFYNSPWRMLGISIACGMAGHGLRFLALAEGAGLPFATFLACGLIGLLVGTAAKRLRLGFSAIAFAGAVPMMPGTLLYRSIVGAIHVAIAGTGADPADAARTFALGLQAALVVGAMVAGLFGGALVAGIVLRLFTSQTSKN